MMKNALRFLLFRVLLASCLSFAVLFTAGCPKTVLQMPDEIPPELPSIAETIEADLARAQLLLSSGDAGGAEKLFGLTSTRPDATVEQRVRSLRGFAMAAVANDHPFAALNGLDGWRANAPGVDATDEWLSLWSSCLAALPQAEGRKRASAIALEAARPWKARVYASSWLAASFADSRQAAQSIAELNRLAKDATDNNLMAIFEETLFARLGSLQVAGMQNLAAQARPENEALFPFRVIMLEQARRMLAINARALQAIETLERLTRSQPFASPSLLGTVLADAVAEMPTGTEQQIALLLPLTGPFAEIGWKIVHGANAAQWELTAGGSHAAIHLINTEAPGWLNRLANLPASCRAIGGPLRTASYSQARQSGALAGRALFSFTQRLDAGDEGIAAWRFFGSPEDQVAVLLDFAASQGATAYGILHPNDSYGLRMAEIFTRAALERGFAVNKTVAYPLGRHAEWTGIVRSYLSAWMIERDPIPNPNFQATFLPDNWLNSEMLVPNLLFYNEEKQILLATNLWEQDLSARQRIDARNFGLAVFPSAWDPELSTPAAVNLNLMLADAGLPEPDYWTALGYDFVRFALYLDLSRETPDASAINMKLSQAPDFSWSAAPLRWNSQGIASQDFRLFTPSAAGYRTVDPEQFARRLERTRDRQGQRIQMIRRKAP